MHDLSILIQGIFWIAVGSGVYICLCGMYEEYLIHTEAERAKTINK